MQDVTAIGVTRGPRAYERTPEARRYCSFDSGSSSSSSSSDTTNTTNIDRRVAVGQDSNAVTGDNSSLTVTTVDAGAVSASFGFASDALNKATSLAASSVQQAQAIAGQAEQAVADAYSTAKAGEQKVLVGVGLVIAGIVAVAALRGLRA